MLNWFAWIALLADLDFGKQPLKISEDQVNKREDQ